MASLIMKTLESLQWIPKNAPNQEDTPELSIVFDNCLGQNKNNTVLRLVPYLVEVGHFSAVNFIFLVVGHTKNTCDRHFNTMKKQYRVSQIFTMDQLCQALGSENVSVCRVDETADFMDYDTFLNSFYRKMPKIIDFHIFSCCKEDLANNKVMVTIQESDIPGSKSLRFNSSNMGFRGRDQYPKCSASLEKAILERKTLMKENPPKTIQAPGLNPYKKVEMFKNYSKLIPEPFRGITCLEPSAEEYAMVKKEKTSRSAIKIEKKKDKRLMMAKLDDVANGDI